MELKIDHPLQKKRAYQKEQRTLRRQNRDRERVRKIRLVFTCIILLAVCAIPAIVLNSAFGYLPVISVALLLVVSRIYVALLLRGLVFEENSDIRSCTRGTPGIFRIHLRNRFVLLYPKMDVYFYISDLFGGEDDVTSTCLSLSPKEDRTFEFEIRFAHIGTYEAGLQKVVIHDLFGFFQRTLENENRYQIRVAPKVYDLTKLHISNRAFTESRNMLKPTTVEGADYTGVREYVPGDPIKNIHWKLSARTNGYMTRQFESYGNNGVTILMDFQCPDYDRESMMSVFDGIVETALSTETYAKRQGMEAEIVYLDKRGARSVYRTGNDRNHVTLMENLPKISSEKQKYTAQHLLREEGYGAYSKSNIAFCTSMVNAQLPRTLMDIKAARKHPVLFVILPRCLTGEERAKYLKPLRGLDVAGIPYYVVGTAEELMGGKRHVS